MVRLTDHQRSGTLDRLRTGKDVVALALLCNCHKTTSIRLREWFPKYWYVKYRPQAGQPNVTTSPLDGSLLWVYCRYSPRPASVTTIRIIYIREKVYQQTNVQVFVQEYRQHSQEKIWYFSRGIVVKRVLSLMVDTLVHWYVISHIWVSHFQINYLF